MIWRQLVHAYWAYQVSQISAKFCKQKGMTPGNQSIKPSSRHYLDQQQRWEALQKKLKSLKEDKNLSITYTEIAAGLGLSRQRLFNFLKSYGVGLPIARHNILELWDHLTVPTDTDSPTSQKIRNQRNQLRTKNGHILDELLEAAGFLPTTQDSAPLILPIERIKSRLLSPWVRNDTILCRLADTIIDTILARGGFDESSEGSRGKQGLKLEEARKIPGKFFNPADFSKIEKLFHQELDRFATLGKARFYHDELYELYQSLLENHTYKSFPIDMQAVECEFRTLSFTLIDTKNDEQSEQETVSIDNEKFKKEIASICHECEQQLRFGPSSANRHIFPPIIEVTARFIIDDKWEQQEVDDKWEQQEVVFSYSCCGTHFEAAMAALSNGLGYVLSSALSVTDFFVRSIGKGSESLARVSITLTEEISNSPKTSSDNYQGIWVDQNVILGILNSMTYAASSWLAKRLGAIDFQKFYSICKRCADVKEDLYKSLENTYNYRGSRVDSQQVHKSKNLNEFPKDEIKESVDKLVTEIESLHRHSINNIKSIEGSETSVNLSADRYFDCYRGRLKQKALLAQLAMARSALFRCDLTAARKVIEKLENEIRIERYGKSRIEDSNPITILYESEKMLYMLLTGNETFWNSSELQGEALSQKLENVIKNLREYAENYNTGILDFDIYLAAGQFFGVIGLAKFYFCTDKNYQDLESALNYMIKAAHYSAKVGQHQRVFRCLCYASRICCRLGNKEKAANLTQLVENLFKNHDRDSYVFNSYNAQDHLAKGECSLLFPDKNKLECDLKKALRSFLGAWQKAADCEFDRAFVSSFYNITRVLDKLQISFPNKALDSLLEELQDEKNPKLKYKEINHGEIFRKLINEHTDLKTSDFSKLESIKLLSAMLKARVIDKLNTWKKEGGENSSQHPFSRMIEEGVFLNRLR